MDSISNEVITSILCFIAVGIIGWLAKYIKSKHDKFVQTLAQINTTLDSIQIEIERQRHTDMHILKDRISQCHSFFIKQGYIDAHTMDILEELYTDYKAVNGNSFIHEDMDDLRNLRKQSVRRDII